MRAGSADDAPGSSPVTGAEAERAGEIRMSLTKADHTEGGCAMAGGGGAPGPAPRALKWIPVVDAENCTGCNLCIEACGPDCLELIDDCAVLTVPDACGSEEHCIPVCEFDAIRMEWIEMEGDRGRGAWKTAES